MSSFKQRLNFRWIITWIILGLLSISMIFAFVKIDKNQDTKEINGSVFNYSIGLLDEEGAYEQGTSSIYLKDYYSVDGLVIKLEEDATVTYKLCFYDEDKEFIEQTDSLSGNYDSSAIPETAEYFRVMITPTNDSEVSFFEIDDYAKMLTVTINK